ncbi:UNVERIFIED_ORG: hypothetical protein ABIB52_001648 [Arthrobacter sp. UYCu721]
MTFASVMQTDRDRTRVLGNSGEFLRSGRITRMNDQRVQVWDESREHYGEWWVGHEKETKFTGFLEFENRAPRLTVISGAIGQQVFNLAHAILVHGELESGTKVTLWDMAGHSLEFLSTDDDSMRHARRFSYAISGEHLTGPDQAKFRYSAYQLHGLGTWSAKDDPVPFNLDEKLLPQYAPAELAISDEEETGVTYSVKVYIENFRRLESSSRTRTGAIINYPGTDAQVVFESEPAAPARIHDLLLFDLQALLTFSYQGGAPIIREWLAVEDRAQQLDVIRKDSFTGTRPRGHVFRQAMVLSLARTEPNVLLPAWWRVVEELYPATQVVSLYHHGTRGILESSVASAIAVAEHMHSLIGPTRTRFEGGFLESHVPSIKAAFPGKDHAPFREFLYEALKNNRPTLTTRLKELVAAVTEPRLMLMTIRPDQWIADVKRVRNPVAHTSSHVTRRGGDSSTLLYRVNSQTRAIVTLLVLQQMGLDPAALDDAAEALSREIRHFNDDQHKE